MRLTRLLATTAIVSIAAAPAFADIRPVVNTFTELAHDLRGLTFAADGKVYASGHIGANETASTVVVRFNADGTLDVNFAGDGVADIDVAAGRIESSLGVVELDNGDVVVAVNAQDEDGGQSVYLLRFNAAGEQVTEWGEDGRVEVVFGWANADNAGYTGTAPPEDTAWDLLIDRTGDAERLVVFGFGSAPNGSGRTDGDRYVVRLDAATGAVDPGFNGGAAFSFHVGGTFGDNARRGLIEADGAIVAAGYSNLGDGLGNHIVLFRLLPDGTLDQSFGNFINPESTGTAVGLAAQPGVAIFNPFLVDGGMAECYAVGRLSDGSYVTTGYGLATGSGRESTLGYLTSLQPDLVAFQVNGTEVSTTWGNNGTQAVQSEGKVQPTNEDRGRAMVVLADDRTVHVGRYGGNAAAFVLTADGQLDTSVDGDGIIVLGHPVVGSQFFTAVLSADGTRIAMTTNADTGGARLVILEVAE
ncbi:MAG: hypothetical protein AB7O56_00150 [Bauldia sp.]